MTHWINSNSCIT